MMRKRGNPKNPVPRISRNADVLRSLERTLKHAVAAAFGAVAGSSATPPLLPESFLRILVVRPHNQLGDMLCATPLLRALRSRFPKARIALMTSPVNHEVMLNHRAIDEVILFDKKKFTRGGIRGAGRLAHFIRSLRNQMFDLVLVPSTVSVSLTSDLLARLTGAPFRIGAESLDGVQNPSGFFFNVPVRLDWRMSPHRHQTLRNLEIAGPLGIRSDDLAQEMTLTDLEIQEAQSWYTKQRGTRELGIVLHPGAGKPPNRWPAQRFAQLAKILGTEMPAKIFVTVGPMDGETVRELRDNLECDVVWIEGQPIRSVAAFLALMDLVISNDTGIMHVAAATGTPVLSLFGPTDPGQWAPIGKKNRYLYGKDGRVESISLEEVVQTSTAMVRENPRRKNYYRSE